MKLYTVNSFGIHVCISCMFMGSYLYMCFKNELLVDIYNVCLYLNSICDTICATILHVKYLFITCTKNYTYDTINYVHVENNNSPSNPINSTRIQNRCKVFINPPVVVCPGGVNHNDKTVMINPPRHITTTEHYD